MSIAPLASQSAQPIVVPTSVTQASANTTQTSTVSKNNADADQKQQADTASQTKNASQTSSNSVDLNNPEVKKVIAQLQARDQEVRIHEQAHVAAGGQYVTSGSSYSYQTGPDGKRYAVGGNVGIDVSPVADDPKATINKARQVIQAAMAPAEPSSQDYAVAQSAQSMMLQAQQEISAQNNASVQDGGKREQNSDSSASDQLQKEAQTPSMEQRAGRLYQQTEMATNALVGRVGGYQDSALRLGLSFQA